MRLLVLLLIAIPLKVASQTRSHIRGSNTSRALSSKGAARWNSLVQQVPCAHRNLENSAHYPVLERTIDNGSCVTQRIAELCSKPSEETACVPIEPLFAEFPFDGGFNGLENLLVYKKSFINVDSPAFTRRWYIDLGANRYDTSIYQFFEARYRGGRDLTRLASTKPWQIIGFEADRNYFKKYELHPEVEFHPLIVWIKNTTLSWSTSFSSGKENTRGGRPAIDIADFIQRRVREEDYVVVKMDIEGSEYDVIPHLIRQKVTHLIDEMFVELHTDRNTMFRERDGRADGHRRPDALRLLQSLRDEGVYAHEWH